ncbi:MAG TPA: ATP-dependent protease [Methylococcaceae bacterium]|nr:ATP-dependent protease [Methylococcaceae bacterium]HIB63333.1 ATP-dependent protease [Methylococcaceae bacterium]HIO12922.1 ATP-dependent protease [Methylococcales bacterium]
MPLAILYSRGRTGVEAPLVTVEVHVTNGLPSLSIVGLPEATVKESKDRVRGAIINSQFNFPVQRITINLAPADLPKEGGRFDLAIALGILAASGQLPHPILEQYEFVGELSLSGALRPISGILPVSLACKKAGKQLILPVENHEEAQLVNHATNLPAESLLAVCAHLHGQKCIPIKPRQKQKRVPLKQTPNFAEVHGHFHAKRAFEIAATGQHNMLLYGPPGTGKSMLASCLPSILPSLNETQALETAAITSLCNKKTNPHAWFTPPFRSPHHSASATALVGGGSHPKPGEISLAHNGVLFLDELPEFDKKALEVLREPLETGVITISRANKQSDFPSRFQLIAAMNPCPCGYLGDPLGRCQCTTEQVNRYRHKISAPLLDRIDIHLEVPRVKLNLIRAGYPQGEEDSQTIKQRVNAARNLALSRTGKANALLTAADIKSVCPLPESSHQILEQAIDRFGLSHRGYHRILKLSRTIADLAHSKTIELNHLTEAISYRKLDRTPKSKYSH